jgi:putative endopeptidase
MNFDYTVNLDDDFYKYINNKWIEKSIIPDDNMIWNVFNELKETNLNKIYSLLNKHINTTDEEIRKVMILFKQLQDNINQKDFVKNTLKK